MDDNEYDVVDVSEEDLSRMRRDDVAVYGNGKHTAPAIREGGIMDNKLGPYGRINLELYAKEIVQQYKDPTVYRTDREGGNIIRPWDE